MRDHIEYLIVPGWHGSGPDHWQSHWQALMPRSRRIQVKSWVEPDPKDWRAAIGRAMQRASSDRVVLVAHSLGCVAVAAWAASAPKALTDRVEGALLVAPADVERPGVPAALTPFAPWSKAPLPFPALVIGSDNDRAASEARAREMGEHWGANVRILNGVGHINAASGHHRWTSGLGLLARLQERPPPRFPGWRLAC